MVSWTVVRRKAEVEVASVSARLVAWELQPEGAAEVLAPMMVVEAVALVGPAQKMEEEVVHVMPVKEGADDGEMPRSRVSWIRVEGVVSSRSGAEVLSTLPTQMILAVGHR